MPTTDLRATADAVWRMEAAKIVATLTRGVGDVGLAEDLAQEALVDALTQWPSTGVPRNPGAWLTTVAKRKAIDQWRRDERLDERYAAMARELETELAQPDSPWDPDRIDDDVLRLIFVAAHPLVAAQGRIALTLRVVGGLTTEEIARAFLVPTATVAQRIVRAKKTLATADVPFEVPDRSEYPERLSTVLSVIYLIYNEGYSASFGQNWIRDELCTEALRLGRILAALVPDEPEVHALVALMEFQSSRFGARTAGDGTPILLADQDRANWDRAQINRGTTALARADALGRLAPSPVVELNRAIAVSMATGPAEALQIIDRLTGLDNSYLRPSVRGELLARLGRHDEAAREFEAAAALTGNDRERDVLLKKARNPRSGQGWSVTASASDL
jgi:RNA polymerase sigma factor (sigma-70 family)